MRTKAMLDIRLFFWIMLVMPVSLGAQNVPLKSKLWIDGRVHYGFVIPHHENMIHLTSQHLAMFALDIQEETDGTHDWERQFNLPVRGVSLLYSNLGGSRTLGSVVAVLPYLDFDLTRKERINLFFRFGAGLGYLTKHFDRVDNYKNIAIGSHFNAGIQMMFEMRWKVKPRVSINAGISLTHFSNGCIKTPNLGINIVTLSAGMAVKLDSVMPVKKREIAQPVRAWDVGVFGIFGVSELYPAGGRKYPAVILSSTFLRAFGARNKMKIGPGVDLFYDEANVASLTRSGEQPKSRWQLLRPGLNLSYKLQFNRLGLLLQLGGYLYTRYKGDGYIYDRLALQYTIADHYVIHLGLKTHLFTADMIEYGFGYKF